MVEKNVTSISPCENASENTLCLLAPTLGSPKIQPCNRISWTRATGFSRKLALTTSYGASDTALVTSPHASSRYGVAYICWVRLCKPCDASSATARRRRRVTNFCLLRASRHPVETVSSKWTLPRDSDCVQKIRQQPPLRRDTPSLYHTCHQTTAATFLL